MVPERGTRRPAPRAAGDQGPPRRPSGVKPTPPPPSNRDRRKPAKIALAILSTIVLTLTGYGWAVTAGLIDGLTMTDVIGEKGGGDKPADGARDILLVGMDSRTDAQGNPLPKEVLEQLRAGAADGELNTDTLLLLRVPNDGSKAVTFSFPRDSYVDIPDGYGKHKINSAYTRAKTEERRTLQESGVEDPKELEVRSNQAGAKKLIGTVEGLSGVTVDNYASINLLGFYDITQAVGGVDVCLNSKVDEKLSGARFEPGPRTVAGGDALAFVRQRHDLPNGDLDRVVRQQVFMAGLARKILSAGTLADPGKLNDLINATQKSVVLNEGWDILKFAEQMQGLTGGQLEFKTIPVGGYVDSPNDGSAIEVKPNEVHAALQQSVGLPVSGKVAANAANAETTVDVRNASGVTGLAAEVSGALTGKGFTAGETANAESRKNTVIRYAQGGEEAAKTIASTLGNPSIEPDAEVPAGHVTVLLGADYSGPGTTAGNSGGSAAEPNSRGGGAAPAAPAPQQAVPSTPPITAGGVPCVN